MFVMRKIYRFLRALGFDPIKILSSVRALPLYWRDLSIFRGNLNKSEWSLRKHPILDERNAESAILGEYFWQDLFVAKRVIESSPGRHIDVGSRVDGFIAHVACVRSVEVFDIRPLTSIIPNVTFTQWDITNPREDMNGVADCVTCLHTLEHFGLGRYGDPLDTDGWKKGLASLASLLRAGGGLWLSVPIGVQRIEFNAHRVFSPITIRDEAERAGLAVAEFHYLEGEQLFQSTDIDEDMHRLGRVDYGLGIFYFTRNQRDNISA